MLEGYALCQLCGVDLKVSSRGRATFLAHVKGKKHMLRDSCYRLACGLPLLDEHGSLMSARTVERHVRLVECRPVSVVETAIALTVVEVVELELKSKSAWSKYFGSVIDSTSVVMMWLAFIAGQLKIGSKSEQTDCQWSIVKRLLPKTEALLGLFISFKSVLESILIMVVGCMYRSLFYLIPEDV